MEDSGGNSRLGTWIRSRTCKRFRHCLESAVTLKLMSKRSCTAIGFESFAKLGDERSSNVEVRSSLCAGKVRKFKVLYRNAKVADLVIRTSSLKLRCSLSPVTCVLNRYLRSYLD